MPRAHSQHSQHSHRRSQSPRNSSKKKTGNKSCGSLYTWLLSLLAVFLLGTVLVLSVVKSFFGVDWNDAIDIEEVKYYESLHTLPYGSSDVVPPPPPPSNNATIEKIPRILHQTWKSSLLPSKWAVQSKKCQEMHKDFEYKLWTDESSLEFIKEFYPWFLPTFLGYKFDIQRADAIRYFVLHKYGGVYMDLDIGCRRPMHPLLNYQTILPVTKPVGISNDLMFAEPNSKFMDSVIHNLVAFDHTYISDYPTVMFSTGPMFLSAVLSLWNSRSSYAGVSPAITSNPNSTHINSASNSTFSSFFSSSTSSSQDPQHDEIHTVRILPKELYGKNVDPELVPDSFFYHYYGSSWHQNDSAIFTFLGSFGKTLMNVAFAVVILGGLFIFIRRIKRRRNSSKSSLANGGYGLLQSGRETPNGLGYDSDVEDGNGRATPPLHQLPHSARSTPSSSRRRRRQHRRAITSGARNWLFGNRLTGLSLGDSGISASGAGNANGTSSNNGRLRRSASTGAIALPLHSSESEDAQFYTSSSEDGRESRRDSIFGIDGTGRRADVRRASIWMGKAEDGVDGDDDGDLTVITSSRTAPLLHRRTSSQPGLDGKSANSTTGSRTPVPPSYLELPPPPPYRPPSPISPTLSASSLLPLPLSPSHRTWLSSFFSSVANTARSPSPSAQSSSQLPFFSNNTSSSSNNQAHYHHSRSTSNQSQSQNQSANHARQYSVPSYPSSPSVVPNNNHNTPASAHSRQQSSNSNAAEVFISHYDERSPARRSESIDDDAFSLHSVKARR